jgi:hypothetical protein
VKKHRRFFKIKGVINKNFNFKKLFPKSNWRFSQTQKNKKNENNGSFQNQKLNNIDLNPIQRPCLYTTITFKIVK